MQKEQNTKKTNKRYGILAMVFLTVVINYLDRSNISVAAFALSEDLDLSSVQMGFIFSAFAWTYAILQIPGGFMADKIKTRVLYSVIMALWSIATLVQGMANSFVSLLGLRATIGVFEAPSYPTNNVIVTRWFPEKERASAIAIYTSGQFLGLAFLTPVLTAIQSYLGWRGLFYVSGAIGLVWAVLWYVLYRDPKEHATMNQEEIDYIAEGGGLIDGVSDTDKKEKVEKFSWSDLREVFSYRKLWGLYIGQFCLGTIIIFFLTWFPTYLVKYRGLDFLESGFLASIPFLAAFFGVLLSGFTSDFLIKRGYTVEIARKLPIICGMLLSTAIIGANYTDDTFLVILFLSIAFFGNGLASIAWVFISLMAPKKLIGLTGGAFNFIGGLAGIVVPVIIGYLVKDGDFKPALFFIGAIALLGFISYTFIVGKVERIVSRPKN
ncbi:MULTISPECIES: MFS transporter [Cellulophaga]|uniref:Glucarate transporter n=1 Tax=Cellulophaga baltica 18 TaxID=1348584 RepID=A0AAU8RS32_9FLAO|nr:MULTISPECIES: MFS transporter [Cellulophaga]AIZ41852.1 glucarate transporter [Cellulophaga baltica 18]KGK30967.1 glucarate transporter [Cellulophaga sp. E6(2014)]MCR1026227.1 MFS transporter [Cellulophaga baltica]WFO17730.1 MFS transporter [Cellulophaga baltica 4]